MKFEYWWHWAIRLRTGQAGWVSREDYAWLWREWGLIFPDAAARCVMMDHLHALSLVSPLAGMRRRLAFLQDRFNTFRGKRGPLLWDVVSDPTPARDREKWLRDIRYIHLNPVREGLVRDPLQWPWSTHRDWLGLGLNPAPVEKHALWLPWGGQDWRQKFHRYVSADPSTGHTEGTPAVQNVRELAARVAVGQPGIGSVELMRAWVASRRLPNELPLKRKGRVRQIFMREAVQVWGLRPAEVAQRCGVLPKTVADLHLPDLPGVRKEALRTALLPYLVDPRLKV